MILAIIGVITTIVIGYLGVKYTLKYRKKTNIIFLKNSCISLFKTIVRNLDDLEINFQGKKIDENLIIFRGTFFNNGNVDIDKSIIHKPLEIELPDNYSWVRHKIISASEGLNVELTLNGNKLIFDWDLFKEGEYITFDSLVEYKSNTDEEEPYFDISTGLLKKIIFNHRITNLKHVNKEVSILRPMRLKGTILILAMLVLFIFGGVYISTNQYFFPSYKVFNEINVNSSQHFIELIVKNEHEIRLKNSSGDVIKVVSKEELNKILGKSVLIEKEKFSYWKVIFGGLFSMAYLIAFINIIISDLRENRLNKKYKSVAEKYDDLNHYERNRRGLKLF